MIVFRWTSSTSMRCMVNPIVNWRQSTVSQEGVLPSRRWNSRRNRLLFKDYRVYRNTEQQPSSVRLILCPRASYRVMKNARYFRFSTPQCNQGGSDYQKDKDTSSESILRMLCTANVHSLLFQTTKISIHFLSPFPLLNWALDEKNHVKVPDTLIQALTIKKDEREKVLMSRSTLENLA